MSDITGGECDSKERAMREERTGGDEDLYGGVEVFAQRAAEVATFKELELRYGTQQEIDRMDALDFIEAQAAKNATFRLESMELLSKRGHTLLTLLLGGGAASGAYALGRLGQPDARWAIAALVPVALWWFALAAWVVVRVIRTQEVYPPANEPMLLLNHLEGPLEDYRQEQLRSNQPAQLGVILLRRGELEGLQKRIEGYAKINNAAAATLDRAYLCAAATPLWALLGLGVGAWLK